MCSNNMKNYIETYSISLIDTVVPNIHQLQVWIRKL